MYCRVAGIWNWIVCSLLTGVLVRCECPRKVLQMAQMCTDKMGISLPSGPNKFIQFGEVERAKMACRDGLFHKTVKCLRTLTTNCTGNTEREHILRMMVNPDQSEKSVTYFCENIDVYEANAECIAASHAEQSNCTHEVQANFKTKAMATVNMDVMMTSTCRFFRAAISCSSHVITRRCGKAAGHIVLTIMKGFEPPKCLEEDFHSEGTYTVTDGENAAQTILGHPLLISLYILLRAMVMS